LLWPTVVRTSPREPLFHSGFPLVGPARLDGALCSLVTLGPDALAVVNPPERTAIAAPLEEACRDASPRPDGERGRVGRLVRLETAHGPVHGYVYPRRHATGLIVAFSGLGMPAAGWINQRFAETAALHGLATFAPARDEAARPIWFDPRREALRALDAAAQVASACAIEPPGNVAFVGISMGGLEALLANREALQRGYSARAAVLDPLLDVSLVADHLDSFWHPLAVDSVQAYFRRILTGRYGEDPPPAFREVLHRTASHREALTDPLVDTPPSWLCQAQRDAYAIFLSDTDPVLGDRQRDFARACGFPLRPAGVPGHTPLACRPALFEEMVQAIVTAPRVAARAESVVGASIQ
jgi:hypothetical protein